MRMTQLFSTTLRETPADAEVTSHKLLLRAGFIHQLSSGIYSYLPLAKRSMLKIENIMREEINQIGGQEIMMPVVHPVEIWQETGRWFQIGSEMGRFKDKNNHDMVLSMTHEEVIASLARDEIRSYRQLPQLLYHIHTKWRDDPRPRAGLIRAREFTMKDSYSLDADYEGLHKQYEAHLQAYNKIFRRCALPVTAVKSDTGMMGGNAAHEFMYVNPIGEDTIMICDNCGYSANRQIAVYRRRLFPEERELSLEKVATPDCKTINDLTNYLSIPTHKTAKAVFMIATIIQGREKVEQFVFVIVRGDTDVNETKLATALHAVSLRPATDQEIRAVGAIPGYASPVGINDVKVIVDDTIPISKNLVSGANIEGYHLRNVNYGRDYQAEIVADISMANEGDECIECGRSLHSVRGVEVGNTFKLGTWISEAMGCYYLDSEGKSHPIVMGSYGIGIGRLLACIAEEHHDEYGLKWPISVAPYQIHLIAFSNKRGVSTGESPTMVENLYQQFNHENLECLYDDREESPGIKFNDADLIGNPIRLTISERSIKNGGVEFKRRDEADKKIIPFENILPAIKDEIRILTLKD